ncbi:hypothetical protein D2E33_04430 [Mycobacteroides abscessus]|uniref:hypothetical protein n=1 Tax=Mycobacteroides abscessus TaxID=36809 RepID=UPI000C260FF1|nr:hypothetical protein [Mycobacteroides abscessus]RIR62933.1 hypothetical protein D2E33_04430 [Mycobacteroides abscessus]
MIGGERNQLVSLHTHKGVQLDQYDPDHQISLGWTREQNQASKCEINVSSSLNSGVVPDIVPWLHWISVWDECGRRLHWTGPVVKWQGNRDQLSLTAFDMGTYFKRQRNPITKRWEATDPAFIARELIEATIERKGVYTTPIVRPDPRVDKFDFQVTADDQMLDQTISSLVNLGLRWAVAGGVPVLGPMSLKPLASLGEHDFMGGSPVISRDGTNMANDILLRAADSIARDRVEIEGIDLQRIVNIDDMFSVSNANKATRQLVRSTSRVRDTLELPGDIRLHPEAPIDLDQLVPSARFTVGSYGVLALMELQSMQVSCKEGDIAVSVTMDAIYDEDDPIELDKVEDSKHSLFGRGSR